jgi:hypothetical protein
MRAVRPEPSPADLRLGFTAGVSEVSRFSCMKFLGVSWGLRLRRTEQKLAFTLLPMLPCTSRCPTQNSGPSGSLVLSRKNFAFSVSCRFSPAHCNRDVSPIVRTISVAIELWKVFLREGLIREFTDYADMGNPPSCPVPEEFNVINAMVGHRSFRHNLLTFIDLPHT